MEGNTTTGELTVEELTGIVVQSDKKGIDGRRRVNAQGSITDQKITDGGIKRLRLEVR